MTQRGQTVTYAEDTDGGDVDGHNRVKERLTVADQHKQVSGSRLKKLATEGHFSPIGAPRAALVGLL